MKFYPLPTRHWIYARRHTFLICFIACLFSKEPLLAQAGKVPDFYGNQPVRFDVCPPSFNFANDTGVDSLVTYILKSLGVVTNRYIVKSCQSVSTCQATVHEQKPYILYNPAFLGQVKGLNFTMATLPGRSRNDWIVLTVLAHELGHHYNNHITNPGVATVQEMELEADKTAGFIVYLLGGSEEDARAGYMIPEVSEAGDIEHPGRAKRLNAVAEGWRNARSKYPQPGAGIAAVDNPVKKSEELYYYHYRRGEKYYEIEEYDKALREFNQCVEMDDLNADGFLGKGAAYWGLNDHRQSMEAINRAILLKQDFSRAYLARGILRSSSAQFLDFDAAMADYNKAIATDGRSDMAYYRRAELKEGRHFQDFSGALSDYNRAIELDPTVEGYFFTRAMLKMNSLEDYSGALADLSAAIKLDPEDDYLYYTRAILKTEELNDHSGALQDFNKAIVLDPNNALNYEKRAVLKANHLNDYSGALSDFNKAEELQPNGANRIYNRGLIKFYYLNDKAGACQDFRRAAALGNEEAKDKMAEVCR